MKTNDKLDLAHWAANTARAAGAADAKINISNSRDVEVEFRDGQLDNVKESTQNSLNINVYVDGKYSGHSTNDLRRESLSKFITDAVDMTKYLTEDNFRKLPDPTLYQGIKDVNLDLIDPEYEKIIADKRVKIAKELQEITAAKSDKIISSTAGYYDTKTESVKVHTNGFEGIRETTSFSVGVQVTVSDGGEGRPSDWNYATTRYLDDIPQLEMMADKAVNGALEKLGQTKIDSGVYDMIIQNRAATNPIYALYGPLGGRALQQKRSFLEGKVGEKIGSDKLTVIDDPFIHRGLGSRHYDSEGLATRKRNIIENGVLKEYLIDCYYGNKLGMKPTGGSTSNITFAYGDKSLDEMIKGVTKGILVTQFIGGNSNGTTGDYSWGVVGKLIENGKLVRPVNEINISGNLIELWNNLVEVGNDPYIYSSIRRPSLHFKEINFAGI